MAGKKSSGKTYISKGQRSNVNSSVTKANRLEYRKNFLARMLNQLNAWKKGKKVVLMIENNTAAEKRKKPFVKVEASKIWGDPRNTYRIDSQA